MFVISVILQNLSTAVQLNELRCRNPSEVHEEVNFSLLVLSNRLRILGISRLRVH